MKPFISIYLNRVYRLRLTVGVILEYEQLTESKLCELDYADVGAMTSLLWLMMRQDVPDLSFERVGELVVEAKNKIELFVSVRQAVGNAFTAKKSDSSDKSDYFDFSGYIKMAAEIGLPIRDLYELTPAEFTEMTDAYIQDRKRQRNNMFTLAWYTANFRHLDDPKLEKYLIDVEKPPQAHKMTGAEMLERVKVLNAIYGGKVVEV